MDDRTAPHRHGDLGGRLRDAYVLAGMPPLGTVGIHRPLSARDVDAAALERQHRLDDNERNVSLIAFVAAGAPCSSEWTRSSAAVAIAGSRKQESAPMAFRTFMTWSQGVYVHIPVATFLLASQLQCA